MHPSMSTTDDSYENIHAFVRAAEFTASLMTHVGCDQFVQTDGIS